MDLTEAEGLADLLAADTEQQRALALQNVSGLLRHAGNDWRNRLLRCMAHIEVRHSGVAMFSVNTFVD